LLIEIEQALNTLEQHELEAASRHSTSTALVGSFIAGTKGADVEPEDFNPYAKHLYQQQAKEALDQAIARTFLKLSRERKIPAWAIEIVDMKLIRTAAQ
jgi:hypothetical protein